MKVGHGIMKIRPLAQTAGTQKVNRDNFFHHPVNTEGRRLKAGKTNKFIAMYCIVSPRYPVPQDTVHVTLERDYTCL